MGNSLDELGIPKKLNLKKNQFDVEKNAFLLYFILILDDIIWLLLLP